MKTRIFASREVTKVAKLSPTKKINIYSMFPIDRAYCECQKLILDWKKSLALLNESQRQELLNKTPFIECPHDKTNMKRFKIICASCGEGQAYCWATDSSLKDWFDLHYIQWTGDGYWHGCLTPHISPVTQQLCLECCCGQDTRDFKANMTLNYKIARQLELINSIGREFGKNDSKFIAKSIRKNLVL